VSRRIEKLVGKIDVIHAWPLGAVQTLKTAARFGIPTLLERPNAHTEYAYSVVEQECKRLGITMPDGHEHAYNHDALRREQEEYQLAYRLLCPSDFVARTFLDKHFPFEKLARHQYGFDENSCHPQPRPGDLQRGIKILFAGGCAPRKGLHYALEAWLRSPAHHSGTFLIAGEFIPGYAERLSSMLAHDSVQLIGYRKDLPEIMASSDVLILPSIEEGSALVTSDARGSGCVLLVSEAAGAICEHMKNALVHSVGDVDTLSRHITMLHNDRGLLERLRAASLSTVHEITWKSAGIRLLDIYRATIEAKSSHPIFA
jgi:glycosyltransferase involved in cell wall biosynthesis